MKDFFEGHLNEVSIKKLILISSVNIQTFSGNHTYNTYMTNRRSNDEVH